MQLYARELSHLVYDAYGSLPAEATLDGNTYALGDYNSCLEVHSHFRGHYCLVEERYIPSLGDLNHSPPISTPFGPLNVRMATLGGIFKDRYVNYRY